MSEFFDNLTVEVNNKEWTKLENRDVATVWKNNRNVGLVVHVAHEELDVPELPEQFHEIEGFKVAPLGEFLTFPDFHYWVISTNGTSEVVINLISPSLIAGGISISDKIPT